MEGDAWIWKPGSMKVPPWCSVFHQSTEKCTSGMSTAMSSAATAQRRARMAGSAGTRRSARYPISSSNSSAVEVSRASHVHQTPHTGRPHNAPVTSVSAAKTAPTSTADAARRSQKNERVRGQR